MTHTPTQDPSFDTPISIKGLVTDPTRYGYQLLYNYESTYWRALVGNASWSLYEVLRSFCHTPKGQSEQKEATCYPSINLLADILGLKERRVITGYTKTVKGKEYKYEGLIETLQQHELIICRELGTGRDVRYEFDVILHLPQLTKEQVSTLPSLLQEKHQELLDRCKKNIEKKKANRRPSKVNNNQNGTSNKNSGDEGIGNLPIGIGNLPEGIGNLPNEQYINNNQLTLPTSDEVTINNNSSGLAEDLNKKTEDKNTNTNPVVVALISKGIAEKTVNRLVDRYNPQRIQEKIDYLEFIQFNTPDKIKRPSAWLRRAIEDNYAKPDGFIPVSELKAIQSLTETQKEEKQRELDQFEEQRRLARAEEEKEYTEWLNTIYTEYGTTDEEIQTGQELKQKFLYSRYTGKVAEDFILLSLKDNTALFGYTDDKTLAHARHPNFTAQAKRNLKMITNRDFDVQVIKI